MKNLCLFLFVALSPHVCLGENFHWMDEKGQEVSDQEVADSFAQSIMDVATEIARKMQPVYKNLMTCLPIEEQEFQVVGMENDLCHFKYVNYDCFVPLNIAEEYAKLGLSSVQEVLKGNLSTQSPESSGMQEILSNKDYCSYNEEYSVAVEYDDSNLVKVKDLIME